MPMFLSGKLAFLVLLKYEHAG